MNELITLKIFLIISIILFILSIIGIIISLKIHREDIRHIIIFPLLISLTMMVPITVSYSYIERNGSDDKFLVLFYGFFTLIGLIMLVNGYIEILDNNKNKLYIKEKECQDKWK